MTSEPSTRRFRSISDDNAGDDESAEPVTPWPGGGTLAPTLPLQRIRAPVFTFGTVVTVGPVTLIEPNVFAEPHPAAKPTATSAGARIAFTVASIRRDPDGCHFALGGHSRTPAQRAVSQAVRGSFRGGFGLFWSFCPLFKETPMPLLWILVIALVILAVAGGAAVSSFLWLVLIVALIVAIFAFMSGRRAV